MKTRHCLIIEDSAPIILLLKSYLNKIPFFNKITSCDTASEALGMLATQKFDLVFLDIELPDFSGLTLLKGISPALLPPTIIISSHSEYAIESYEIGKAVDFLKKPFDFDRFMLAINRALAVGLTKNSFSDKDFILLKKGRTLECFHYEKINFIEAYGIYTKIHTSKGTEVVNENISSLESKLNEQYFMRVHKSFIVNVQKITNVESKYFIVNQEKVPIGRFYKPKFDALFQLFDSSSKEDLIENEE